MDGWMDRRKKIDRKKEIILDGYKTIYGWMDRKNHGWLHELKK